MRVYITRWLFEVAHLGVDSIKIIAEWTTIWDKHVFTHFMTLLILIDCHELKVWKENLTRSFHLKRFLNVYLRGSIPFSIVFLFVFRIIEVTQLALKNLTSLTDTFWNHPVWRVSNRGGRHAKMSKSRHNFEIFGVWLLPHSDNSGPL